MSFKRELHVFLSLVVVAWSITGLTGCGGGVSGEASLGASSADAVAEESGGDGEGDDGLAPDFALVGLDGEEVKLSDSSGKVRLIDFWATWCAPCREEIPMLNELQASYGDRGFQIVAIAEEEREVIRDFVEEHGVEYLNLVGTADVSEAYGVLGLPAAYLIDGDGRVVDTFLGPKPRRVLVKKIEALLGPASST